MSDSGGVQGSKDTSRKRGRHAKFEGEVESCRIHIEHDPGRTGGPHAGVRPQDDHGNRAEEQPKVRKVWDPWAEDEPVFGSRERRHALSRHPGTPPCGNLAVQHPDDAVAPAPSREAGDGDDTDTASGADAAGDAVPDALCPLESPLRVELELGFSGRWTFGLVERASRTGFEARLGGRAVGTRDFVLAGRRVKVLVTPHGPGGSFVLPARVLWVDPPPGPDGPMRAQLALMTEDPAALERWVDVVGRALRSARRRAGHKARG